MSAAIDILKARVERQEKDLAQKAIDAKASKEKYEELTRLLQEVPEKDKQRGKVEAQQQKRLAENQKAVDEFEKLRLRLEENREMLAILESK